MKRTCFFIAILALFAFAFISCSKDVEKCWKVDVTMKYGAMETTITNYIWATENDIDFEIEKLKREYADGSNLKMTVKKSVTKIKTEETCFEENESLLDYLTSQLRKFLYTQNVTLFRHTLRESCLSLE